MNLFGNARRGWAGASGNARGMLWMVLVTFCWMTMQAGVRLVSDELHPLEIGFFRNLFGILVLVPIFVTEGFGIFRTRRLGLHAVRATVQAFGMLCTFVAISLIPLANVTALSFSSPVIATIGAALILGETVRRRRWTAVLCGFLGVLIVLRPGFATVSLGHLLVLAASTTWASCILMIRVLGRTEASSTSTAYMAVLTTVVTLFPALFVWTWPTPEQLLWLTGIGLFGTAGHFAFAQALRTAEATAVMPIDFLRLVWATFYGWALFGQPPDFWTWVGGSIIFTSATYIALREARVRNLKAGP